MTPIKDLLAHEIADFFAGYGSPGFPDIETGAAQKELIGRVLGCIDAAVKESGLLEAIGTTSAQYEALANTNPYALVKDQSDEVRRANSLIDELRAERNMLQRLAGERGNALEKAELAISVMATQLAGADQRIKAMFEAKNHWANRARDTEAQIAELAAQKPVGEVAMMDYSTCSSNGIVWVTIAITAEKANFVSLDDKLFTRAAPPAPVMQAVSHPRIEGLLKQWQFERDCEWIEAIRAAGGSVADE